MPVVVFLFRLQSKRNKSNSETKNARKREQVENQVMLDVIDNCKEGSEWTSSFCRICISRTFIACLITQLRYSRKAFLLILIFLEGEWEWNKLQQLMKEGKQFACFFYCYQLHFSIIVDILHHYDMFCCFSLDINIYIGNKWQRSERWGNVLRLI